MSMTLNDFFGGSTFLTGPDTVYIKTELSRVKAFTPSGPGQRVVLPKANRQSFTAGGPIFYLMNLSNNDAYDVYDNSESVLVGIVATQSICVIVLADDTTDDGLWYMRCSPLNVAGNFTTSSTSSNTTGAGGAVVTNQPFTLSTPFTPIVQTHSAGTAWLKERVPATVSIRYVEQMAKANPLSPPPRPEKVSVIMSVLNDDIQLSLTIDDIIRTQKNIHEIIVIDDCSQDRVGPALTMVDTHGIPLKLIEFDKPRGVGPAREAGCEEASGDTLLVIDSHMRFPVDCITRMLVHLEKHPESIICPCSAGYNEDGTDPSENAFLGTGAYFRLDKERGYVGTWLPLKTGTEVCPQVPAIMGACYLLRSSILKRLGGWGPGLRGWGLDEEYLSARAWLLGAEVRLAIDTHAAHLYREKMNTRTTRVGYGSTLDRAWEFPYNRHVIATTIPENPRVALRRANAIVSGKTLRIIALMMHRHRGEIARVRKYIQSNRIMSDWTLRRKMRALHRNLRPIEEQAKLS